MIAVVCGFCGKQAWLFIGIVLEARLAGRPIYCDTVCQIAADSPLRRQLTFDLPWGY